MYVLLLPYFTTAWLALVNILPPTTTTTLFSIQTSLFFPLGSMSGWFILHFWFRFLWFYLCDSPLPIPLYCVFIYCDMPTYTLWFDSCNTTLHARMP